MSCIPLCLYTTHLLSVHLDREAVIWMSTSSLWKAMKMFVCLGVAKSYGSCFFFFKWEKKLLAKNDGRNGESLTQVMKG